MVSVAKIEKAMFPQVYDSFLKEDDPYSNEQDWKNLFNCLNGGADEQIGYALFDGSEIVGILGMRFSKRTISGKIHKFCNLHSWFVKEKYRGKGLFLMRPVLKLRDHTVVDFTPTQKVDEILKRLGFQSLNSTLTILLPFLLKSTDSSNFTITGDGQTIRDKLSRIDSKIFDDHRMFKCQYLLLSNENEYCYIVYSTVIRHWLPYCYIHYISNKKMFATRNKAIRYWLVKENKAKFVAVDSRVMGSIELPFSFALPVKTAQLYKSNDIGQNQIDTLYSEVLILNLTTFPNLSKTVGSWIHRLWPRGTLTALRQSTKSLMQSPS